MLETDVLVIGGGATGGGIAWDLALRGVRVLLVDMGDLATGTSGRYHGLLHSGGRYAVRDAESAKECIDENRIVRRIVPEAIEDTSGFFVLCPGDDESYVDQWLAGCAAVGIETRDVPLSEALKRERALNPKLRAVYEVPDGTCDSWDLLHGLQKGARETGWAQFLTYHRVEALRIENGRITGATVRNLRNDEILEVTCACIVNASGPWAAEIGKLAGVSFGMRLSRGAMLAYNIRWVNTVINKLRAPGDGDIFVPVGTVSVIGTTSVTTPDPGDNRVEAWEVTKILDEAEAMTPGISRARILRAWGGVRPLYDPGSTGRDAKRTFTVLDHAASDGIEGMVSVLGGKLTTYRLMAEKVSDAVCAKLGVSAPCMTATTVLPSVHEEKQALHHLRDRLGALENGELGRVHNGELICECEIVTRPQIVAALQAGDVVTLNDLRRDLRLGMGPCQGGFCAFRAAGICHEYQRSQTEQAQPDKTRTLLSEFVERRFGGMKPLLWGHNLRQALLAEQIYGRIVGVSPQPMPTAAPSFTPVSIPSHSQHPARIVVVGAGLAGLTAALVAAEHGAKVELVALGQGALTLHPGWIETGDVEGLAAKAGHPYEYAGEALVTGLGVIDHVFKLYPAAQGVTSFGTLRPIAYTVGLPMPDLHRVLVVGFAGWRDFYAGLVADNLRAAGIDAASTEIDMPHLGGNFDNWTVDLANWLDAPEGVERLIMQVKPKLNGATEVGFPAVLGFKPETRARIADALGVQVFEIPTLTPSVPGLRLYHALRRALIDRGGRFTVGSRVVGLETKDGRVTGVQAETAAHGRARILPADAVILATGGLFGGGLESDYQGRVWETVANLPVANVPPQGEWFPQPMLSGIAQPIHLAGLATDADLRPLDSGGKVVAANLYAAGRLLAGASPVVEGCAEGVDIATGAHAARRALTSERTSV
jgi:glycerol-3-phosphate dehydrogenase